MRADPLPVRKQLYVKANCPHLKEGETKIKTLVKFTQNRRYKDTTRKMRSTSHTEEWKCNKTTNTITVTKINEESGVVGHPRCKTQHCKAVSRVFCFIIIIHNGEKEEEEGERRGRKRGN
jgi:hypothetical protein